MAELKPCPFCGGENCETYKVDETVFSQNKYLTLREDMMKLILWGTGCYDCSAQIYGFDTEQEAIEAWNTRAEKTCKPEVEHHGDLILTRYPCCGYELKEYRYSPYPEVAFNNCPNFGARVVWD